MTSNEYILFYTAIACYAGATILYLSYLLTRNSLVGDLATGITIVGLLANTATLVLRTYIVGHAPFSNMYEYSTSFAWGIILIYLFAEFKYKFKVMGAFVVPIGLLLIASTDMLGISKETRPLMPALQSNWLTAHVIVAIFAYGAYAFSFGLAIMYFIKDSLVKSRSRGILNEHLPSVELLDELSYRFIVFAFPLMSLVIITGAIWAEFAWGRYWSWDPKETWSLITWLVYSAYLHARLTYGWKGHKAAILALIGFITVLFTYFGVNMVLPGLHSYA